ncbi:MAG: hypothetical protein WDN31_13015 [Hyphomicrobium sp.]
MTWAFGDGGYASAEEPRSRRADRSRLREMRAGDLPRGDLDRWGY